MTILDLLNQTYTNNKLIEKSLQIIKESYINLVNDNYELVLNEIGKLTVKMPSLEKKDEYIYKDISEYEYSLVMCMRISTIINEEGHKYVLAKFMEIYKDKLELFFKDVNNVDKLMEKVKNTKSKIDYITYFSIGGSILLGIFMFIFKELSNNVRYLLTLGVTLLFTVGLVEQFTKEAQIKKIVDAYISIIKTDWYRKELRRQYIFLCNFTG
ncbi:hypothetical protein [Clostridium weizhouense]|uniref:SMODS and SLOG-associating 2TM effector domain-containing protein n=1 Tax=Clostridium weizhouense TaxID=2859781 RepID=A0ABS7AQ21_9CLOT|nr:hypothetical protein [Clostridium weizhouense]MBW6410765.1 hypothetical protein [Clostridium weizhouense]